MAVQAQYPSNLLFLNKNVKEEKTQIVGDYMYNQQSQTRDGIIDQNHIFISNGVEGNPRKRTREFVSNSSSPMNPYALQPHPSQLVDLQLAFGEQQQQQQSLSSRSSVLYPTLSDDLTSQIGNQRNEIQQFLYVQGEQLRRTLAETRHKHYRALLGAAEESVSRRLKEKEAESMKAAQRNAELEAQASRLSAETCAWQTRARAGEAAAVALQAQLQQAVMSGGTFIEETGTSTDDEESVYVDPDRVVVVGNYHSQRPTCKACRKGVATVVLLPCRHLSICTECDSSIKNQACPVCFTSKESSVEVYFS